MVSEYHEGMAHEILTPAFHNSGNGVKLTNVRGRAKELGAELLAKVSNGMTPLH